MKYIYILPEACTESRVGFGVIFKLIHIYRNELMCVQGAYVYCMYRQSEIWLCLGTGSGVQIDIFMERTVQTVP